MKKFDFAKIRDLIKEYIPPDPYGFKWLDILRVCFGVDVLIFAVILFNEFVGPIEKAIEVNSAFLVTALMIFLMPKSPMFHPKAIIEGNLVSALLSSAAVYIFPDSYAAIILSVGVSAVAMYFLKCFQPTALILALFMATGKIADYHFAFFPIFADSLVLVLVAYIYGQITKHPYPAK